MADFQGFSDPAASANPNTDAQTTQLIAAAQQKLRQQGFLAPQDIPPGYEVQGLELKPKHDPWDWVKGAAIPAAAALIPYGIASAVGAGGAAGGASIIGNPAFSTPLEAFPGAAAPAATATAAAATGARVAGATGSASTLDRILNYAKPVLAGAALAGSAASGNNSQPQSSPEMDRLLAMQRQRLEASNPLYEAVLRSAFGRMPTSATQGLQAPSMDAAASQVPPVQTGGNYHETQGQRDLLRQQEIRMQAGDPVYQAIQRLAQSRLGR